jgi:hypothetical protein
MICFLFAINLEKGFYIRKFLLNAIDKQGFDEDELKLRMR